MAQIVKLIQVYHEAEYAVMQRANGEYVAGWLPRIKLSEEECREPEDYDEGLLRKMYWSQGHYFQNITDAQIFATRKEIEAKRRNLDNLEAFLNRLESEVSENG